MKSKNSNIYYAAGYVGNDTPIAQVAEEIGMVQYLPRKDAKPGTEIHSALLVRTEKGDLHLVSSRTDDIGRELGGWEITTSGDLPWIRANGKILLDLCAPAVVAALAK